jgi:hypothetical protein
LRAVFRNCVVRALFETCRTLRIFDGHRFLYGSPRLTTGLFLSADGRSYMTNREINMLFD